MPKLTWFDVFEIDHDEIDHAHQILIAHAQHIESCLNDPIAGHEVSRFIDALEKHCHREEEILLSCKYPKLEDHKLSHKNLLEKVKKLQEVCDANSHLILKRLYYDSIIECVINDFLKADINFKTHLLNHRLGS